MMQTRIEKITIGSRTIGAEEPVFIIAEAGVNHNGDLGLAKQLIDVAAEAGVDAVKFQSFKASRVASATAPKSRYQLQTTNPQESQQEMLRRLELTADAHLTLRDHCRTRGVLFLSTPFDEASAELLHALGVPAFKIASGELTNEPFLQVIARKRKPIVLSTGMAYLSEVDEAVRTIREAGNDQVVLSHCISNYPADPRDSNLRAMQTMARAFQLPVGFSDHTPGVEVALAAVALGACLIEKHFTVDKSLQGPDHQASLLPLELQTLVKGIRTVERTLGTGTKAPAQSELENRVNVRRSLAAAVDLPQGTVLDTKMLITLRPATGIPPFSMRIVLGRTLKRPIKSGELLGWEDLV